MARSKARWPTKLGVILRVGIPISLMAAGCGIGAHSAVGSRSNPTKTDTLPMPSTGARANSSTRAHLSTPSTRPDSGSTSTEIGAPAPVPTTTTTLPATPTAFRGIYEFAGNNSAADATNPDLSGVVLVYYWSQIEPQKGVFDWTLIDDDMTPWVAAGKKVILRVSTSGEPAWDPPYSGAGTPQWVFSDGTRSLSDNGETIPIYWDSSYLADYTTFVENFAQHFDGNPNVAFVEPGIGMGGETLPETNASGPGIAAWQSDGYTDSLWITTIETIASTFADSFHRTAIFPLVDMTFFEGNTAEYDDLMTWFRAIPNWGLQYDGLTASQALGPEWTGRPLALEQRNPTRTSHDCLCGDIANGLGRLHGNYLLIYRTDIDDSANAGYLHEAAATARSG